MNAETAADLRQRRRVFGPDGRLYVSSRETRQILRFDASTGKPDATPFIDDLEDFPEFIALVGVMGDG